MELPYSHLFTQMTLLGQFVQKHFFQNLFMLVFLNEYNCALEFPTEFEPCKIALDLQQNMQRFGYDIVMTCEVVTKDKLNEIEQGREEPNPSPSLDVTEKTFETPTVSAQQIEQQVERVTQNIAN